MCVFERGGYVILRRIRCPDKAIRSEVILQPRGLSALVPHSDELLTNGEQPKLVLYECFQICLLAGLLPPVFIGYMSPSIELTQGFSGWSFWIKWRNGSKKTPLTFRLGLITINIQSSPPLSCLCPGDQIAEVNSATPNKSVRRISSKCQPEAETGGSWKCGTYYQSPVSNLTICSCSLLN